MANFIAIFIISGVVTAIIIAVATLFGYEDDESYPGLVFLIVMFLMYLISKAGERLEKREEKETKERQQKEEERLKEELILELKEKIANLNIEIGWYLPELEKIEKSFYMLLDTISKEEEKLIDLERRHPKVQLMIKTRKIGDSKSKDVVKVENLLKKLKKKVEPISTLDSELNEE
ncbi:hypothetical protein OAZ13_04105 [Gammaproteobacteria bacterium]|nr:hypothetical protein [Gammaproteobacteria bacterium]